MEVGDKVIFVKATGLASERHVQRGNLVTGRVYTIEYVTKDPDGDVFVGVEEIKDWHNFNSLAFSKVTEKGNQHV